ncbi:MAG: hypothetical protein Q9M26_02320 [Mariprofundales bacterium]|nr:hypothetical protein [Mariprofundales bacterium]
MMRVVGMALLLLLVPLLGVAATPSYNEKALNHAIQENPDDATSWFRLGVLQTHDGRTLQAIEAFHQVVRINPRAVAPHYNLAAIYRELEDEGSVIDELKQVVSLAPRDIRAQQELAQAYLDRGESLYRLIGTKGDGSLVAGRFRLARALCQRRLLQQPVNKMAETLARLFKTPAPEKKRMAKVGAIAKPVAVAHTETVLPIPTTAFEQVVEPAPVVFKPVAQAKRTAPKRAVVVAKVPPMVPLVADHAAVLTQAKGVLPTPHQLAAGVDRAVRKAIERWRQAWSARDVAGYLASYGADFNPGDRSLASWRLYKRHLIKKKRFISVALHQIRLKYLAPDRVSARFIQDFSSDGYTSRDHKGLTMVWQDDQWRIVREITY